MMLHKFRPELAKRYGLPEAVLLYYVEFWCSQNETKQRTDNYHNGRWWMFNTSAAIADELGYLSKDQVKRLLAKLVSSGALIVDNFNKRGLDRTAWYTLGDEVLRLCEIAQCKVQNCTSDGAKSHNAWCEIAPAIPIETINNKPNNKPNAGGATATGGSLRWRSAIATLEAVWGLTIGAVVVARIESLVTDFGEEVFLKAVSKAVRANERNKIHASRVINYISKTCAGLADGVDFDNGPVRGNNVAASVERVERELGIERGDSNGNGNSGTRDTVWGVWGSQ